MLQKLNKIDFLLSFFYLYLIHIYSSVITHTKGYIVMKLLKILFTIVFTLILIIAIGIAFLIYSFDANHYKTQIVNAVKKQTGRDLVIDGDLKLAIFPNIAIELGQTSLSNAKNFNDKPFAIISSGQISVKVMPLLKKKIELNDIRLQDLKLNLQRKADGITNWDDLVKKDEKTEPENNKKSNKVNQAIQESVDNLSITGISLQNAHIHWIDEQTGQDINFSPVNLKTGAFKPNTPLPIELALTMKQNQPAMTVTIKADTHMTLGKDKQHFSLADLKLDTLITGKAIADGRLHAILSGNVEANSKRITVDNLSLQTQLDNGFLPKSKAKTTLKSPLSFDLATQTLSMPTLSLQTQLSGKLIPAGTATINLDSALSFDVKKQKISLSNLKIVSDLDGKLLKGGKLHTLITAKTTQLNLVSQQLAFTALDIKTDLKEGLFKNGNANTHLITNKLHFDIGKQYVNLKQLKLDAKSKSDLLQGAATVIKISGDSIQIDLAQSQLNIPALSLDTTLKGGAIPSGQLTQYAQGRVNLNWNKKTGGITLPSLQLTIGNTQAKTPINLQLKGSNVHLKPLAKNPSIEGQFETNTFNLKQVLKMLGITPPVTTKPSALTQVQANFYLQANPNKAVLNGLKMKLDNSQVSGNFALNDITQKAIVTTLKIDRIIIDDYLAPPTATNKSQITTPQTAPSTQSKEKEAELLPLESLRNLNLQARLNIGQAQLNKLKFSNMHAQIKANNGLVQLNPATANFYQGIYKGNITIDAQQTIPTIKMRHELAKLHAEDLLFDLFSERYLSGSATLVTDLSSRGNTLPLFLQNLNGKTRMDFKEGHIRDSKLAKQVALAVQLFEKKEIKGDKSIVTFTGLSGDWETKQGVFNTNNLRLLSPYFTISGAGSADVAKKELDMKVRISSVSNEKLFAPLRIYGSFTDPKFKLDLSELIKSLAKEDLEKIKLEAKEKLKQAERDAKEKLKQRFEEEKITREKELKTKFEKEKQRAMDKLKEQVGEKAGEEIQKQLEDKLKDGLRNLF